MVPNSRKPSGDSTGISLASKELRTLCSISQSLHEYLFIDDLIAHIINKIKEAMGVEAVSILLHDEADEEFIFYRSSDISHGSSGPDRITVPDSQGIAGSVFKSGKAEIILDVGKDSRHYTAVDARTKFQTRSMIAAPLRNKDRTIGVLEVLNKIKGTFGKKDLNFLLTLSPIVAMALENGRMYSELESAYGDLQRIDRKKDMLLKKTKSEVDMLRQEVAKRYHFEKVIGKSKLMSELFRLCEKVINSDITVLIQGESGTGKELIARTIHFNSMRSKKPFTSQNCGGIPDNLLASELFGHKRGAFTGAFSDRKGLFEVANGGTIFLDEVGEMSPAMQTSLLRVLQEGEIKPLGSDIAKKVNVRVISATNRDLEKSVARGEFREDLFYRLNVFPITLPPLRERREDIPLLANHFLKEHTKGKETTVRRLSAEALQCLQAYEFPGNVRELENEVERAMTMAEGEELITVHHLSDRIRSKSLAGGYEARLQGTLRQMVESLEQSIITKALEKHGGNKSRAAEELGLSRFGLTKKLNRYSITV